MLARLGTLVVCALGHMACAVGLLSSYVGAWYMCHWCHVPRVPLHSAYQYDMLVVLATQVWALLGPMCLCVWLIDMECWLCLVHGSLVVFGRMCLCPWPVDATGANVPLHLAY